MSSLALTTTLIPVIAATASPALLVAILFAFGASLGTADCVMNLHALVMEKSAKTNLISGMHGCYSIGGIVGAVVMSLILSTSVHLVLASLLVAASVGGVVFFSRNGLMLQRSMRPKGTFCLPREGVLYLGIICCIVFWAEGAVLDWSGLFLTQERQMQASIGVLGYAFFSLTMTAGRLTGDKMVAYFGPVKVVNIGAAVAAVGMLVVVAVPFWPASLLGFALVGAGCANIVPIMFSAASRLTHYSPNIAVPAVSALGYMGLLCGPAGIGAVAHYFSLSTAFVIIAAAMSVIVLIFHAVFHRYCR